MINSKNQYYYSQLFLRVGLGFAFIYAAISSLLNSSSWIGFAPDFITLLMSKETFLTIFSAFEIFLGLWLFSNKKIFYASTISSFIFAGMVFFNFGAIDIVFRDIALFFSAIALAIMSKDFNNF